MDKLLWKKRLFEELIEMAMLQVGDIVHQRAEHLGKNTIGDFLGCRIVLTRSSDPSPSEADEVRADIVEALALAGDLAVAEEIAEKISPEGHDEAVFARQSIIRGWAKKDLGYALKLASLTAKTTGDEDDYVDEDEQKVQRQIAMFVVLETIAETSQPDMVRKLADRIVRQSYKQGVVRVIRVRATAAMGKIDEARKMAAKEKVPCYQLSEYLAVYEFSQANEDILAARAIAERFDCEPWEHWLKIAKATRDPRDIARARAEITAIPVQEIEKGWSADFRRYFNLLALAKISADQSDITVAREALLSNPESVDSLFMELCRITRDRNDFAILLESTTDETDIYSALACIAEISQEEADFITASTAAMEISDRYLRGRSLAELAQVLCGKQLSR
ncbi:MAG: hypothetical protein AAB881_00710 [Patescibacteria group bacterium]